MERFESGSTLGSYRIEARIGRGGMGVVYRATHIALDRPVALKVIAEELAEDEGFRERFRREPKLAASIDHPNVIPVFDAGEVGEHLFVAMRYVEGSDLSSLIADQGRLEPARAVRIVSQVAEGLDAAHELGLVHRDVKPANVLIEFRSGREHVYLTDFGLTKGGEGTTALTKTGQWVGTPDYVAPEQIHGGTLDRRTDVYALGAVLYHALSGQPPYGHEAEVAKIYAHLSRPPPELPDDVDASEELKSTIRRAMAKEAVDRYPTAGQLGRHAVDAVAQKAPKAPTVIRPPGVPAEAPEEESEPPSEESVPASEESAPESEELTPAYEERTPAPEPSAPADVVTPARAAGVGAESALHEEDTAPDSTPGLPDTVAAGTAELEPAPEGRPSAPAPGIGRRLLGDRRAVGAVAVLATAGLAAAGFLVGSSGGDDDAADSPSSSNSVSAGTLALRPPAEWERTDQAVPVPGFTFRDRIDLAPAGAAEGAGLAAGQVNATGPKLLPSEFLKLLGAPPSGEPVGLDGVEALRYANLEPRGFDGKLTVFAVPTTDGVATTACAAPTGTSQSVSDQCEQVAATLRLEGAKSFPIGPDDAYAGAITRTMETLDEERNKALKQAADAKKPTEQATALDRLAGSYADAAQRLRGLEVSPAAQPGELRDRRRSRHRQGRIRGDGGRCPV